jgi:hypothetical protein
LTIDYKVGGTSYSVEKSIGVDVTGKVILEIINVDQSRGNLQIEVANIGTRTAEGVKAILTPLDSGNRSRPAQGTDTSAQPSQRQRPSTNPLNMLARGGRTRPSGMTGQQAPTGGMSSSGQQLVEYKSDIKPTKQTTFTFETTVSGPVLLTLEYTGLNNERVTQTERLDVGGYSIAGMDTTRSKGGTSITQYLLYLVVLLIVWAAYRKIRHKSLLPGFLSRRLRRDKSG